MSDTGSGVCPAHDSPRNYITVFNIGASSVLTNSRPSANVGTVGISTCGHPTVALMGSPSINLQSRGSHRVGDTGSNAGAYVAIMGSNNVFDNNNS
jgi:hypothetical protein